MAAKINKNKVIAAAQKFVQKNQFDRAIKEYRKIVDEDPRDVRIWLKIGDLYAKKKSSDEAIDTYLKVAEFYAEQGFYLKAVAVYKQILKLSPRSVDVNLKLAELYKQLGLLNDAMQQYELVSNHFQAQGRTKDALAAVQQIVELDPENVGSRIKLAELYSKEEMRAEAVEEFSKAADFLRANNRIEDFIKVAERLVFHQPENHAVAKELASLYLRRQDPRRALQKLQLAFKVDPRDDTTLALLAQAFEDLGQVPKTISVLKELAHILAENGKETERLETYRRILVLAPEDRESLEALGAGPAAAVEPTVDEIYPAATADDADELTARVSPNYEVGDPSSALDIEAPETTEPAESVWVPDDYAPADQYAVSVADIRPAEVEIQAEPDPTQSDEGSASADVARVLTEAEVYIKYGLHDKAIDHLRQIFNYDPNNLEVRLKLRDLHVQVGRLSEAAQQLFEVAQVIAPADPGAAAQYLNEALELDAKHTGSRELLAELGDDSQLQQVSSNADKEIDSNSSAYEATGDHSPDPYSSVDYDASDPYETADEDFESIDLDASDILDEIPLDADDLVAADELLTANSDDFLDTGEDEQIIEDPEADFSDSTEQDTQPSEDSDILSLNTSDVLSTIPIEEGAELVQDVVEGIDDDLEEAEFFLQQNLLVEARTIIEDLVASHPKNPLVKAKAAELERLEQARKPAVSRARDSSADIAADLAEEVAAALPEDEERRAPVAREFSVGDIVDEARQGADKGISEEDSETHYDLGIAYREMGLVDDAINEFKVAMKSPDKEALCHMMIGLCHIERGMVTEAIGQFKAGLYVEGISDRESIALYFELGQAYENLGDEREALYYYEKVTKKDATFRGVAEKISALSVSSGGDDSGGDDDPSRRKSGVVA